MSSAEPFTPEELAEVRGLRAWYDGPEGCKCEAYRRLIERLFATIDAQDEGNEAEAQQLQTRALALEQGVEQERAESQAMGAEWGAEIERLQKVIADLKHDCNIHHVSNRDAIDL